MGWRASRGRGGEERQKGERGREGDRAQAPPPPPTPLRSPRGGDPELLPCPPPHPSCKLKSLLRKEPRGNEKRKKDSIFLIKAQSYSH